ncbi:MAG: PQQ-binding-like beta-propeller repeat protein [Pirellulaceae bacterium]
MRRIAATLSVMLCLALGNSETRAEDWPQWMGPERNGVYEEDGLIRSIPESGLRKLWSTPIAAGYAGPAVAGDRVFVTDYVTTSGKSTNNPGKRDAMNGKERVLCLDEKTGKEIWKFEYERPYSLSYANGPRATPTVDGDRVYVLGAEGDLLCLQVASGDVVWRKQLAETYDTESPIWGYSAHPLIYGDMVITLAGGKGSAVVALDKMTGAELWKSLTTADIGYCPPTVYELGGKPRLVIWHSDSINCLELSDGSVYWTYKLKPRYGMSIAAPQLLGNRLFACGIGETSAMLELDAEGKPGESLWDGTPKTGIYSGNATALFTEDAIYGADCGSGKFIAVNPDDGSRFWESFALTGGGERRISHGTSFVVLNEDVYFIFAETGDLILAKLSTTGFSELGRTRLLEPTGECFGREVVWSHPAFANRCVFARNDKEIVCYSLAAEE